MFKRHILCWMKQESEINKPNLNSISGENSNGDKSP